MSLSSTFDPTRPSRATQPSTFWSTLSSPSVPRSISPASRSIRSNARVPRRASRRSTRHSVG
eukprot:scaffold67549_cov64-Phaeocystis_antarctica.AAC.4